MTPLERHKVMLLILPIVCFFWMLILSPTCISWCSRHWTKTNSQPDLCCLGRWLIWTSIKTPAWKVTWEDHAAIRWRRRYLELESFPDHVAFIPPFQNKVAKDSAEVMVHCFSSTGYDCSESPEAVCGSERNTVIAMQRNSSSFYVLLLFQVGISSAYLACELS